MTVNKAQYTESNINGKDVFIFEDHSTAILPWRRVSASLKQKPFLITFDFHTDCNAAFRNHGYWTGKEGEYSGNPPHVSARIKQDLLNSIDKDNEESILKILPKLRNDEHIDASIKSGILSHSFSIQFQERTGTEPHELLQWKEENKALSSLFNELPPKPVGPFNYTLPANKMFVIPGACPSFCINSPHNKECLRKTHDLAIDDQLLSERLATLKEMDRSSGLNSFDESPYILDIDLDYFNTKAAINPQNKNLFYELIQKASAITVAQESSYVEALKKDDDLTTSFLLEALLEHIKQAL